MSKFNKIHSVVSELQHADQETRLLMERSLGVPCIDNNHLEYKFCFDVSTLTESNMANSTNFGVSLLANNSPLYLKYSSSIIQNIRKL
jgi:hypothetical protein